MSNKAVVYGSNHPMDAQEQCHHLAVASRPVSHCMEWCTNSKYICSARCLDLLLSKPSFLSLRRSIQCLLCAEVQQPGTILSAGLYFDCPIHSHACHLDYIFVYD